MSLSFQDLPSDSLTHILSFCGARDLCASVSVNHEWYSLIASPSMPRSHLWAALAAQAWARAHRLHAGVHNITRLSGEELNHHHAAASASSGGLDDDDDKPALVPSAHKLDAGGQGEDADPSAVIASLHQNPPLIPFLSPFLHPSIGYRELYFHTTNFPTHIDTSTPAVFSQRENDVHQMRILPPLTAQQKLSLWKTSMERHRAAQLKAMKKASGTRESGRDGDTSEMLMDDENMGVEDDDDVDDAYGNELEEEEEDDEDYEDNESVGSDSTRGSDWSETDLEAAHSNGLDSLTVEEMIRRPETYLAAANQGAEGFRDIIHRVYFKEGIDEVWSEWERERKRKAKAEKQKQEQEAKKKAAAGGKGKKAKETTTSSSSSSQTAATFSETQAVHVPGIRRSNKSSSSTSAPAETSSSSTPAEPVAAETEAKSSLEAQEKNNSESEESDDAEEESARENAGSDARSARDQFANPLPNSAQTSSSLPPHIASLMQRRFDLSHLQRFFNNYYHQTLASGAQFNRDDFDRQLQALAVENEIDIDQFLTDGASRAAIRWRFMQDFDANEGFHENDEEDDDFDEDDELDDEDDEEDEDDEDDEDDDDDGEGVSVDFIDEDGSSEAHRFSMRNPNLLDQQREEIIHLWHICLTAIESMTPNLSKASMVRALLQSEKLDSIIEELRQRVVVRARRQELREEWKRKRVLRAACFDLGYLLQREGDAKDSLDSAAAVLQGEEKSAEELHVTRFAYSGNASGFDRSVRTDATFPTRVDAFTPPFTSFCWVPRDTLDQMYKEDDRERKKREQIVQEKFVKASALLAQSTAAAATSSSSPAHTSHKRKLEEKPSQASSGSLAAASSSDDRKKAKFTEAPLHDEGDLFDQHTSIPSSHSSHFTASSLSSHSSSSAISPDSQFVPVVRLSMLQYFEITIEDESKEEKDARREREEKTGEFFDDSANCVAIGLGSDRFKLIRKQPGWDIHSYGLHSDDGSIFHGSGSASDRYTSSFGVGDTVGCGFDMNHGEIFFTKNGRHLGVAFGPNISGTFFPVIGLDCNWKITLNLGDQAPFVFDVMKWERKLLLRLPLAMPNKKFVQSDWDRIKNGSQTPPSFAASAQQIEEEQAKDVAAASASTSPKKKATIASSPAVKSNSKKKEKNSKEESKEAGTSMEDAPMADSCASAESTSSPPDDSASSSNANVSLTSLSSSREPVLHLFRNYIHFNRARHTWRDNKAQVASSTLGGDATSSS